MKWVAGVAQLVEQRIRNAKVGGSIPLTGTMFFLVIQSITRLTPRKSRHDKIASPLGGVFFSLSSPQLKSGKSPEKY